MGGGWEEKLVRRFFLYHTETRLMWEHSLHHGHKRAPSASVLDSSVFPELPALFNPTLKDSPALSSGGDGGWWVGTGPSIRANLKRFAVGIGPWRPHALPSGLWHSRWGGGNGTAPGRIRSSPRNRPRASACWRGGALTVHGAAGI